MRIVYWVTSANRGGVINTSVTGQGSIEEECYTDALNWVKSNLPFSVNVELKKVAELDA